MGGELKECLHFLKQPQRSFVISAPTAPKLAAKSPLSSKRMDEPWRFKDASGKLCKFLPL